MFQYLKNNIYIFAQVTKLLQPVALLLSPLPQALRLGLQPIHTGDGRIHVWRTIALLQNTHGKEPYKSQYTN